MYAENQLDPLIAVANGGPSSVLNFSGFDDDGAFGVTIHNQGTGGHLNVSGQLLVTASGVTIGTLGATTLSATTLNVSGTSTLGVVNAGATSVTTLAASGTTTLNGDVTLGNAAGDAITVNGTPTFATAVTFSGNVTVNGNTTLGNANTDTVTVVGVSTFRNAAATLTQLLVDAGNNRVIVGSGTALASDLTPALHVVGRVYIAPDSANDLALELRRSILATPAIRLGVSAVGELVVKDETDTVIALLGGAVYALDVTGDARVSDDFFAGARMAVGATAFSSTEELRVVGQTRLEGAVTVTTGTLTAAGGITLSGPNNIDGNGGTAGQIRIGAVVVNQAALSGAYVLETTGDFKVTGNGLVTGGVQVNGNVAVALQVISSSAGPFLNLTGSSQWQTTVGAAGGAAALPAAPQVYVKLQIAGTNYVFPAYAAS